MNICKLFCIKNHLSYWIEWVLVLLFYTGRFTMHVHLNTILKRKKFVSPQDKWYNSYQNILKYGHKSFKNDNIIAFKFKIEPKHNTCNDLNMLKDRISCDYSRYLEMDIVVLILCFTTGNTENRVILGKMSAKEVLIKDHYTHIIVEYGVLSIMTIKSKLSALHLWPMTYIEIDWFFFIENIAKKINYFLKSNFRFFKFIPVSGSCCCCCFIKYFWVNRKKKIPISTQKIVYGETSEYWTLSVIEISSATWRCAIFRVEKRKKIMKIHKIYFAQYFAYLVCVIITHQQKIFKNLQYTNIQKKIQIKRILGECSYIFVIAQRLRLNFNGLPEKTVDSIFLFQVPFNK
ncbi:hypothetical protein AGLY_002388 [Aphis glycines]|uniref:Uncharacterized protein n=1 Tax=Aphis glycines TaxID=307491 RepID=A0A6G0U395_APHGL|nr:hypothetical protein AGLY_002388 [Aphis glycines]